MLKSYISSKLSNFVITKEELFNLVTLGKIKFFELSISCYDNVSDHDMTIYFASKLRSQGLTPVVYTVDETIALDLLALDINVNTLSSINEKIETQYVKTPEMDTEIDNIYVYDTCYFIHNYMNIDFSHNIHVFPISMLEELKSSIKNKNFITNFFRFLFLYNKHRDNMRIMFTPTSTQNGGCFSYTDLIHLIYTMNLTTQISGKNVILMTDDAALYLEALTLSNINVRSSYMINKNIEYCKSNGDNIKLISDIHVNDTSDIEESVTSIYNFEKEVVNEINDKKSITKELTKDYTKLSYIDFYESKVLSNGSISNIVASVKDSNYKTRKPLSCNLYQKKQFKLLGDCYTLKVGYLINFKEKPDTFYRVVKLKNGIADIEAV